MQYRAPPGADAEASQIPTPLQREKRSFVLALLARGPAPKTEASHQAAGSRLEQVNRVMAAGEEANRGNPWLTSTKRRDKLRKALGYWWAIGADQVVLSWIGFGVKLRFETKPESLYFANHKSYWDEIEHVEKEHKAQLEAGNFAEVTGDKVKIGNPLQVEVNEKGKRRMCTDTRWANAHLADYSFTQETLNKHVAAIVARDMEMLTTDVEAAYYQLKLHKDSQGYCGWRHGGKWILPLVLIFGLSVAPFIFTKVMRVVLIFVRSLGIRGSNCIDDNIWAAEPELVGEVLQIVLLVFGKLGWVFNSKCVLTPSTTVLYNGMWIDSRRFEMRATDGKIDAVRRLAWKIWFTARDGGKVLLKDLQKLTGRLQSIKLALEGVAVWTRGVYADVAKALEETEQRPGEWFKLHLREAAMADLNFWAYRLGRQNGLPINDSGSEVRLTVEVNTDASDVGFGAHTGDEGSEVHGELPRAVLGRSSTAREIAGVIEAAKLMQKKLKRQRVRVTMDSYPAIRNFINGGGPKAELNALVKQWWIWCQRNGVTPVYRWVPREENTLADVLSKRAAATYALRRGVEDKIRHWLTEEGQPGIHANQWLQTSVIAPEIHCISVRIEDARRARKPVCLVLPLWRGQTWWPQVKETSVARLRLGEMRAVIESAINEHGHTQMEAHLIVPLD